MKKILCILISIITILSLTVLCFAHSGRTDSDGGHHVSGTGEYHYHHGHPAHQHPNGICPYGYGDDTNADNNDNDKSYKIGDYFKIGINSFAIALFAAPIITLIIESIYKRIKKKTLQNKTIDRLHTILYIIFVIVFIYLQLQ